MKNAFAVLFLSSLFATNALADAGVIHSFYNYLSYGIIQANDGELLYFDAWDLLNQSDAANLEPGDCVQYFRNRVSKENPVNTDAAWGFDGSRAYFRARKVDVVPCY